MTRVTYEPGAYRLTICGHAGAGERGRDLVCAGVSALGFALVRAAEAYGAAVTVDVAAALIDVRCKPENAAARTRCRAALDTVAGGLRLLAARYPAYVTVKEVNEKCHGETENSMTRAAT